MRPAGQRALRLGQQPVRGSGAGQGACRQARGDRPAQAVTVQIALASVGLQLLQRVERGMGVGQRYIGSSYNARNTVKVPHYTLTDASVRYDLGHLSEDLKGMSVDLSASNLFDKRYIVAGYDFVTGSVLGLEGNLTGFYGDPRRVFVTGQFRF